ncbi:MAG: MMPL family transporter [Pseudomonadota bacterium]
MGAWGKIESSFPRQVIQYRWLIIVASIVLVALAGAGTQYLAFTNSYRNYFGPGDPHRVAFDELEKTYTKDDGILIVIAPQSGEVFSKETLSAVSDLTAKAWSTPHSIRVDSISNFQHSKAVEDDLFVGDLVSDLANLDAGALAQIKDIALNEPALANRLIADDARVTAININLQVPGINETVEFPEAVLFARELVAQAEEKYPEIDFYISGLAAMHYAFTEAAFEDMTQLIPLSFAVMLILLAVLAGGIKGTLITIFVIAFSVVAAMGVGGYLGYLITPTMAPAPNVILTVAVANCVHILISYLHGLGTGENRHEAIEESLRINLHPVALASLTTATGFLTMNFSDVPPFQQMGNVIAVGVVVSFFLSITFLPALLAVLPQGQVRAGTAGDEGVNRVGKFVVAHRSILLITSIVIATLLVAQLPRNEINDYFIEFFDESMEFRHDSDFTIDNLTGLYQINYSVDSGAPGGINEPQYLEQLDAWVTWWRQQPGVVHVSTLTDVMKKLNKNMHGDEPSSYQLPNDRELAAQYLLLYEMSLPYGLDLNNQVNVDKSATRVVVTLDPMRISEILLLAERGENWLADNAVTAKTHHGTGMIMMFSHLTLTNTSSMLFGTAVAIVLIGGILMFALRSFNLGVLSLIPNLAPIAAGFGIWGLFNGTVGIALSIVGSMTLGIVVDDTVHFLSKYLRARRERGLSSAQAVQYAITTVGRALLVTSIVLVAGFLVLAFSNFQLNSAMGILVAIVIALALAGVFLLLPPMLMALDKYLGLQTRAA